MRFSTFLILLVLVAVAGFIYVGVREPSFGSQTIVEVDAPLEHTFAVFNEPSNLPLWLTGFRKIEYLRGEENKPGSYYRLTMVEDGREFIMTEQLIALVENEHVATRMESDMLTSEINFWFEPTGTGTRITANQEFAGKGPFWKSMLWFSKKEMKARQHDDLQRLKVLVEKSAKVLAEESAVEES